MYSLWDVRVLVCLMRHVCKLKRRKIRKEKCKKPFLLYQLGEIVNKVMKCIGMEMKKNKMIWIGLILLCIASLAQGTSSKAASLALKYDGKAYTYTGTKAGVTVDGKLVNLGKTNGIIINDNCMLPAKDVFQKALKGSYSYSSKTNKITIKKDGNTIVMTLGSKKALVNGKSKNMPEAPKKITFMEEKITKVYVPSRFVTENLGYTYQWDQSKKLAKIISPFTIKYDKSWVVYKGTKGAVICDGKKINLNGMPSIIVNNTALLQANSVFKGGLGAKYKYDSKTKNVTISNDNADITMKINSKKATVDDKVYTMSTAVRLVTNKATGKSYVMVPGEFVATKLGYSYRWDSSTKTSIISTEVEDEEVDGEENDTDVDDADEEEEDTDSELSDNSSYQLEFSLPKGVNFSDLTDEDQYYKNRFVISMPSNQTDYYEDKNVQYNNSVVSKYSVDYNENDDCTYLTIYTKKLQGYVIKKTTSGVGVQIGNPKDIYQRIVVLDPGHGASAVGTSQKGVYEKTLNLEILYNKAKKYFNGKDSTIKAYWTRVDDSNPSLAERAKFAEKVGADVFISLHMNSAGKTASGTETLYASNNKNKENGMDSKKMAELFQEYLVDELGLKGRRIVDRTGLYVLKNNSVPAILIELGFLSNANDYDKLTDEDFQDDAAKAIYEATELLYDTYLEK